MKSISWWIVAVAVSVCVQQICRAQEVQIPLDSAGTLQQLDANLERELRLFPAYSDFLEARLFLLADSSFALEIRFGDPARMLRERIPMSAGEAAAFRQMVSERLRRERPQALLDRTGVNRLIIGTTTLAVGFYSWAPIVMFDLENPASAMTTVLFSTAAGIVLPILITQQTSVSEAEARLALYGGTRGILHGIFIQRLLTREDDGRAAVSGAFVGSVGEMICGFQIASVNNLSAGRAAAIGVLGDFGFGIGMGAAEVAGFYDDHKQIRAAAATILAGSAAGLAGGAVLSNQQSYTVGDAAVLRETGLLGAMIPLTIMDIARSRESDTYVAAAMVGSVAGIAAGHLLTRDTDLSATQGLQITLATLAGGLFGMGIGDVVARGSHGENESVPYLIGATLGGTLGFAVAYGSISSKQRNSKLTSWNVSLAPEGLVDMLSNDPHRSDFPAPPLIRASVRF